MFHLTMHPASEGDCLVLAWGDPSDPHHAVIDLGRTRDYALLRPWLIAARNIALFAISHIDADHIAGAMPMAQEATAPFAPADVWFNGYKHLAAAKKRMESLEPLSVAQGDKLEKAIVKFAWPWNTAFDQGPVSVQSPEARAPLELPGGLRLTLLSPWDEDLARLEGVWNAWLKKNRLGDDDSDSDPATPPGLETMGVIDVEALAAQPFLEDDEPPNGSSIAFLAEHDGRRVLLTADAHPSRIAASLTALGHGPQNRLQLDLFKLCHHGSKRNTSPELLRMIDCTRFAISTDGSKHDHPDAQTIARVLVQDPGRPKVLYFNTRQPNALLWQNDAQQARWSYTCVFPPANAGLAIDILTVP